jgi:hypothetical protein
MADCGALNLCVRSNRFEAAKHGMLGGIALRLAKAVEDGQLSLSEFVLNTDPIILAMQDQELSQELARTHVEPHRSHPEGQLLLRRYREF